MCADDLAPCAAKTSWAVLLTIEEHKPTRVFNDISIDWVNPVLQK